MSNVRSVSPTWRWNQRKIQGPPRPQAAQSPERRRLWPGRRDWRKPLSMTMAYKGGAQGDVVLECRGWRWVFPWDVPIGDVVSTVNGVPPKVHR